MFKILKIRRLIRLHQQYCYHAIKIEHPSDITPEDFFINNIEASENIEILAFEDALDNNIGQTSADAQNGALNDA